MDESPCRRRQLHTKGRDGRVCVAPLVGIPTSGGLMCSPAEEHLAKVVRKSRYPEHCFPIHGGNMNRWLKIVFGLLCIAQVVMAQEVDLGELARNRAEWPREVTLKSPLTFPITVAGEAAGEAELGVGERVKLVEVFGLQVTVEHGGVTKTIPIKDTDLIEQVQAQRRARQEAAEKARLQREAEQKAFEQDCQQKVMLDGRLVDRSSLKIEKIKGIVREKNAEGTRVLLHIQRPQPVRPARPRPDQPQQPPAAPQPQPVPAGGRIVLLLGYAAKQDVGQEIEVEAVPKDAADNRGIREYKVVTPPTFDQWKYARSRQ